MIGLPHMGVVLSLSAEVAARAPADAGLPFSTACDAVAADPVMQRLLSQLDMSKCDESDHGVYCDAIRLALVARWLRLRSNDQEEPTDALQKWRLNRVTAWIEEHLDEPISLADMAKAAGLSRMYFAARFRIATGLRPHDYILRRRVERSKELLMQTRNSLVDIAFDVGFQTQAHFTTVFKRFAGTTPGRWRAINKHFA
ncbi:MULTISPECIES: AraC family transcriptional regulator [Mesorhizobium]|uniref:helix-turn-helix domain-containing protein n=1 Tax=Mesorhizobium TaxID=68287 RepID=UPI000401711D|nr:MULTISPECIES: AraC family transcriptional regulator [Mesorhizobium]WJI40626.1 AraC family transcriptional regulator [Mesorhizobium opportunistum]